METLFLRELFTSSEKYLEQTVTVRGWVKSLRNSKHFSFLVLSDGTCSETLQIVLDEKMPSYEALSKMITGYSCSFQGKIVASQGKGQTIEMQALSGEIIGSVPEDYPLQKKGTSLEFLREIAHLRIRTNTFSAVMRVRHELAMATHNFFNQRGFFYVNTPIITTSDCEGAGELFRVTTWDGKKTHDFKNDFFGKPTYLTVSGQLGGESLAMGLSKVYTFGPTFRSENSNTSRHLSEFWMIEPEMAFATLEDMADLAQDYLKALCSHALSVCAKDLAFLQEHYEKTLLEKLRGVVEKPFQKITYTDAIQILKETKHTFEFNVEWGVDLQTEHERYLAEIHFKSPVIVTDYPSAIKAFYMRENEDGKTVRAMDVLIPGVGEIIGGSQREERLDVLERRMQAFHLSHEEYKWYLDLRRFGTVPHAGFGLGFERAVMYVTGMNNIRDVVPFPRTPRNAEF